MVKFSYEQATTLDLMLGGRIHEHWNGGTKGATNALLRAVDAQTQKVDITPELRTILTELSDEESCMLMARLDAAHTYQTMHLHLSYGITTGKPTRYESVKHRVDAYDMAMLLTDEGSRTAQQAQRAARKIEPSAR